MELPQVPFPYVVLLGRQRAPSFEAAKCARKTPPTGEGVFWVWVPPAAYAYLAGYREIREEIRGPPP